MPHQLVSFENKFKYRKFSKCHRTYMKPGLLMRIDVSGLFWLYFKLEMLCAKIRLKTVFKLSNAVISGS